MKYTRKWLSALLCVAATALSLADLAVAQDLPRPSPNAEVSQRISLTDVKITYCRPGVKGRTIWGGLVPYNSVWRTGANEATTISFSGDVSINGKPLSAGKYALFTIPAENQWVIIFNKEAEQWGNYNYKQDQDALRITVTPRKVDFEERLSFSFEDLKDNSATVAIRWENLLVPFEITVNDQDKAISNARAAMASLAADDWGTAYTCANYCLEHDVNLEEALQWIDKSTAIQENYFNLSSKAKLLAKVNRKEEAISVAQKAIAAGKSGDGKRDTSEMEKLLAAWQGAM